jgi:hypothetical protein
MIPVTRKMKSGRTSFFVVVECKRETLKSFRCKIQIRAPYVQLTFRKFEFFWRGRPNEGVGHFARFSLLRDLGDAAGTSGRGAARIFPL